jgi:hypothetical protein
MIPSFWERDWTDLSRLRTCIVRLAVPLFLLIPISATADITHTATTANHYYFDEWVAARDACYAERAKNPFPSANCGAYECISYSALQQWTLYRSCRTWNEWTADFHYPASSCPAGQSFVSPGICQPSPRDDKNQGVPAECVNNPCNPSNGNKYQSEEDLPGDDGRLSYVRHYNSFSGKDFGMGVG